MPDVRTRETYLFDTITHSDPVAAGTSFSYFTNTGTKTTNQQNFQNERKVRDGAEMRVWRIGVKYEATVTIADAALLDENIVLTFLVDGIEQTQGPVSMFPAGGGVHYVAPAATATLFQINNGAPGNHAAADRTTPIIVTGMNDYEVVLRHGAASDMSADVDVQVILYVHMREPVRA